jgi:hypothetical protein
MADAPRVHVHMKVSDFAKSRECYVLNHDLDEAPRGRPLATGVSCCAPSR